MSGMPVKTEIMGRSKASKIPSFGLGRKNTVKKLSFKPSAGTNKKKKTTNLTRRGNSNVLG